MFFSINIIDPGFEDDLMDRILFSFVDFSSPVLKELT